MGAGNGLCEQVVSFWILKFTVLREGDIAKPHAWGLAFADGAAAVQIEDNQSLSGAGQQAVIR